MHEYLEDILKDRLRILALCRLMLAFIIIMFVVLVGSLFLGFMVAAEYFVTAALSLAGIMMGCRCFDLVVYPKFPPGTRLYRIDYGQDEDDYNLVLYYPGSKLYFVDDRKQRKHLLMMNYDNRPPLEEWNYNSPYEVSERLSKKSSQRCKVAFEAISSLSRKDTISLLIEGQESERPVPFETCLTRCAALVIGLYRDPARTLDEIAETVAELDKPLHLECGFRILSHSLVNFNGYSPHDPAKNDKPEGPAESAEPAQAAESAQAAKTTT